MTCRKRRIKCDEGLPRCGQCAKSDRQCLRRDDTSQRRDPATEHIDNSVTGREEDADGSTFTNTIPVQPELTGLEDHGAVHLGNTGFSPAGPIISPASHTESFLLSATPFQWYDLLAQDAISNIQRHNNLADAASRWEFDEASLSRRPSPQPPSAPDSRNRSLANGKLYGVANGEGTATSIQVIPPVESPKWNETTPIILEGDDVVYFEYYTQSVGPLLDLFDPLKNFTNVVPHLALQNNGLLKSILAVAAQHMSLDDRNSNREQDASDTLVNGSSESSDVSGHARMAKYYYYDTLRYISQSLSYQSYADSHEILATAILISTYEMLDSNGSSDRGEWERHIRGSFWIQRCQDNDGESPDDLRRATWWAWLRQDMWAAFRAGRPTLTIWYPKRNLEQLPPAQFATRIVYIAAKVVEYAGVDAEAAARDVQRRIDQGNKLRDALRLWDENRPPSFRPVSRSRKGSTEIYGNRNDQATSPDFTTNGPSPTTTHSSKDDSMFDQIWIHPPSHAGAVQTYHFALIILLLHMPTLGGPEAYRLRQQRLDESVDMICGIANREQQDMPLAFVNMQALYAGK